MGLKLFISNMKLHTGWLPVAVSSGLKRSQKGLKVLRSLWRRDHPCVSHGLKAQRNLRRRAHPRVSRGRKMPRNPRRRAHAYDVGRLHARRCAGQFAQACTGASLQWRKHATNKHAIMQDWIRRGQFRCNPGTGAAKDAAPTRARNQFPNIFLGE